MTSSFCLLTTSRARRPKIFRHHCLYQGRGLVLLLFWGLEATAQRCFRAKSRQLSRLRGRRRPFQATRSRRPAQHQGTRCVSSEPNKLAAEAQLDVIIELDAPVADAVTLVDFEAVARPLRLDGMTTDLRRRRTTTREVDNHPCSDRRRSSLGRHRCCGDAEAEEQCLLGTLTTIHHCRRTPSFAGTSKHRICQWL